MFRHSSIQTPVIKPKISGKSIVAGGCVQLRWHLILIIALNILTKLGYKVEETPQKQCCGAIDQHLSANDEALQKIKKNIDAWHSFEVIISSTSGCGVM
ncbi:Glycolate dehydrogenase (EC, iron-sulfur subunit GlcF [uncultured Gammaproteobacteria bacterium]|nr:Glycolate dehydrogenase (EC, iron-sulfur subunit GlcF [uncultured Gammaproteobacteria bacterium]